MSSFSTARRGLGLLFVVVVALLALFGGSSQGAVFQQSGSFPISSETNAMDINQSTGTIYLTDRSSTISTFDPAGNALTPIGEKGAGGYKSIAVDNSNGVNNGTVYVQAAAIADVEAFDSSGNLVGAEFESHIPSFARMPMTIGTNGNLYIPNGGFPLVGIPSAVKIFTPAGVLQKELTCSNCPANRFGFLKGVAVDSKGNIYAGGPETSFNEKQSLTVDASGGTYSLAFEGQNTASLPYNADSSAIEQALQALPAIGEGNVFVEEEEGHETVVFGETLGGKDVPQLTADSSGLSGGASTVTVETTQQGVTIPGRVIKFDSDGENPSIFALGNIRGIAINRANDEVFVIEDNGSGGEWHVMGYDPAGNQIADFGLGTISGVNLVIGDRSPLAVNSKTGDVYVSDQPNEKVWIYTPTLPTATTTAASGIVQTQATLNGTVNPNEGGAITECLFKWGTNTEYKGGSVPCGSKPGEGNSPVAVSGELTGLSANTTYHYQLIVNNGAGPDKEGGDQSFTTLPEAPTATTGTASAITQTTASLGATVNPKGSATTGGSNTCHLEWGSAEGEYTSGKANCSPSPSGANSNKAVTGSATGLSANTTYHFRVVVTTAGGTANGADASFKTLPNTPLVVTGASSGLAQHAATIAGTINPGGAPVSECLFEYGTSTAYGTKAPCPTPPGEGSSPVEESLALTGLSPATTYHYRLVGKNSGGEAKGLDASFTTPADSCATNAALCPPPPVPTPAPTPTPTPKPLTCKKGFKKKKVKGVFRCVKIKHKHHRKHKH